MKKQFTKILAGLFFLIHFSSHSNALENDSASSFQLQNFSIKVLNETVYINFLMTEQSSEFVYILQKSENGGEFQNIYFTKGYVSPGTSPLLYSFKEKTLSEGRIVYRLYRARSCELTASPDTECDLMSNNITLLRETGIDLIKSMDGSGIVLQK